MVLDSAPVLVPPMEASAKRASGGIFFIASGSTLFIHRVLKCGASSLGLSSERSLSVAARQSSESCWLGQC